MNPASRSSSVTRPITKNLDAAFAQQLRQVLLSMRARSIFAIGDDDDGFTPTFIAFVVFGDIIHRRVETIDHGGLPSSILKLLRD